MYVCLGCGCDVVGTGSVSRSYRSNRCQRERERRERVELWLATGEAFIATSPVHYVRVHIHAEQGGRCAICSLPDVWQGKELRLVLDHIDGESSNNRRENLRLVCPNCDSQLPTYKNRNAGRGRHARRTRYAEGKSY